jgi:hypothetical protein
MVLEGVEINKSLGYLKNVFRILGGAEDSKSAGAHKKKKDVVVYRGNMLTELMQDSLGGASRTLMFVNVGPAQSNVDESIDSLRYGGYVNNISNEIATADADYTQEIHNLKVVIDKYKDAYGDIEHEDDGADHAAHLAGH